MAVSVSVTADLGSQGGYQVMKVVAITMDSSYATGGESVTAAACKMGKIDTLLPIAHAGYVPVWDSANSKILAYWVDTTVDGDALAEVTATTDLSAVVFPAIVIGKP